MNACMGKHQHSCKCIKMKDSMGKHQHFCKINDIHSRRRDFRSTDRKCYKYLYYVLNMIPKDYQDDRQLAWGNINAKSYS